VCKLDTSVLPGGTRTRSPAQVLAAIGNVAVHLLEQVEGPSKACSARHFLVHPHDALPLLA
jgi:hypothetical protein